MANVFQAYATFGSWYRAEWKRIWREVRYLIMIGWYFVTDRVLERISRPRADHASKPFQSAEPQPKNDSHLIVMGWYFVTDRVLERISRPRADHASKPSASAEPQPTKESHQS